MTITKKDLQEALKPLATKRDLDTKLATQTKELKAYTDQQVGALAGMINRRFDEVIGLLDVRKRVDQHERQITKISRALDIKL